MRQPMFLLIFLASFTACATHHPPAADINPMLPPEGRLKSEPLTQVEAEIMTAENIPELVDFGLKAYQEERYDDAIQLFMEVLKTNPDAYTVRYNLGLAHYQQKRYAEAIEAFESVIARLDHTDFYLLSSPTLLTDARINLGMAYLQSGYPEKAIMTLLETMPDETAHYNLIVAYNSMGDAHKVIALAQEYVETYGENASIYNLLGLTYYRQEQYEQATQAFEKAAETNPASAEIQMNLGLLYMQMERNSEAEEAFRKAQKLNPKLNPSEYLTYLQQAHEREARIHYNRANQLMNDGELDAAISAFKQAVELYPEFVQAHINLGVAYGKKQQPTDAIAHLKHATQLDPTSFEAYYNLGIAYSKAHRYMEAVQAFQQAVTLKPNHAEAHYNLGVVLHKSNQAEKAIELFQKAIQLNPTWLQPRMELGLLLGNLQRFEEGIQVFTELLRFYPRNSDAYYNLGVLYLEINDREHAVAALEEAVRYNHKNTRAQKLLNQLTKP
jgi:superkiller protein 3